MNKEDNDILERYVLLKQVSGVKNQEEGKHFWWILRKIKEFTEIAGNPKSNSDGKDDNMFSNSNIDLVEIVENPEYLNCSLHYACTEFTKGTEPLYLFIQI